MEKEKLPEAVTTVYTDQKTIYLVGTAHVSKESVDDVRESVAAISPDTVCIELCEPRYKTMKQRDNWKNMDVFKVIKEGKAFFLLGQLILSAFYKRLGAQLGVEPGAEMMEGIRQAEQSGATLVLADRPIEITLKRVWGYLSFWKKMDMLSQVIASLFVTEKIDESTVENLKQKDQLEGAMEMFGEAFPEVKKRLIDERDIYLAQKIKEAPGNCIVAVIGAGHVPGIVEHIQTDHNLAVLETLPPKSIAPQILKWGIPAVILVLFIAGFLEGGRENLATNIYIWVLVNGILSAVGAAIAFAHPITIAASFIAAPLTSLNPTIGAGIVAGLIQALVKKPTVGDLENLSEAITSVRGFWYNPMTRILLVVLLVSLGSMAGTFISGGWIAARFFN